MNTARRSLWAGRTLALLGILLVALNLRTAVAAMSPISALVAQDIPLDSIGLGIIGTLPPIAFGVFGVLSPLIARRIGLERAIMLACAAMAVGPVVRAMGDSYFQLVLGSIIALAGMGIGNILLPPAVKKYFPDRLGVVTAAYVTLISLGAAIPAMLAAPVAEAAGWRVSVAVWAGLAVLALIPWVVLQLRRGAGAVPAELAGSPVTRPGRMWRSRTAWAITITFAASSISFYGMFAWLPDLVVQSAGVDRLQAGAMLSLFGLIGVPFGFVVPGLAERMRNVGVLVHLSVACYLVGYLGLLLAPAAAPWVWVFFAGAGNALFPVCLALINLRTRGPEASAALSGFVQSVGYSIAALGPLALGVIHDFTGGWNAPLLFLIATCVVASLGGLALSRPRYVEDEL